MRLSSRVFLFILGVLIPISELDAQKQVLAYYPYWVTGVYPHTDVSFENVTHIAHAFIWPNADGSLSGPSGFLYPQLNQAAHDAGVKIVIAVGGYGTSDGFGPMAADPTARSQFITNIINYCLDNGYDGIDLDWEFPWGADKTNAATLMTELRDAITAGNHDLTLSAAIPATDWRGGYTPSVLQNTMDWVGVMTYDIHGTWTNHAGPNSPLFPAPGETDGSVQQSVAYWMGQGLPASLLNVGIPFYGKQFFANDLYASSTGGTAMLYSQIDPLQQSGWTYHWDDASKTAYLRNAAQTEVITYDDSVAVRHKAQYIKDNNLKGAIIWAMSQDLMSDGSEPLLETVAQHLMDQSVSVDLKVFLAGAYDGGAMRTDLLTADLLPDAQPYNTAPWNYAGTEVIASKTSAQAAFPAGTVDWILVHLRQTSDGADIATRAGLLLSDGTIADLDGSELRFDGVAPGSYYVVIEHRNHISGMTASAIALGAAAVPYDFTTGPDQAYGTDLMALEGGAYGLYAGDATADGMVTYIGADRDQLAIIELLGTGNLAGTMPGYHAADMNLDGSVVYIGAMRDQLAIIQTLGTDNLAGTRSTQVP